MKKSRQHKRTVVVECHYFYSPPHHPRHHEENTFRKLRNFLNTVWYFFTVSRCIFVLITTRVSWCHSCSLIKGLLINRRSIHFIHPFIVDYSEKACRLTVRNTHIWLAKMWMKLLKHWKKTVCCKAIMDSSSIEKKYFRFRTTSFSPLGSHRNWQSEDGTTSSRSTVKEGSSGFINSG